MKNITQNIAHWAPAAFCAFISLMALSLEIRSDSSGWKIVFLCFLPMCFFFVANVTTSLHRELRELRKRLAELEQKKSG